MHVGHAAPAGEQRPNVPPRLRALESAEREPAVGNLGILGVVRGHDQEQPGVRPALVQLTGGVEVARAEAERGGTPERASPGCTDRPELGYHVVAGREVRENGAVDYLAHGA